MLKVKKIPHAKLGSLRIGFWTEIFILEAIFTGSKIQQTMNRRNNVL